MKIINVEKRSGPGFVEWELEVEMDPKEHDELIQFTKLRTLR